MKRITKIILIIVIVLIVGIFLLSALYQPPTVRIMWNFPVNVSEQDDISNFSEEPVAARILWNFPVNDTDNLTPD